MTVPNSAMAVGPAVLSSSVFGQGQRAPGLTGHRKESGVGAGGAGVGRTQEHTRMRARTLRPVAPRPAPCSALAGPLLRHAGWWSLPGLDGLVRSLLSTLPCSRMQEGPARRPQKPCPVCPSSLLDLPSALALPHLPRRCSGMFAAPVRDAVVPGDQ